MIYTTRSFFRDNNPIIDKFFARAEKFRVKSIESVKKFLNSDFEIRIVEILLQIPAFIFILVLGFLIVLVLINKTEPANGYRISTILTNSMTPSIKPGSIIFISPPEEIELGNVILFEERSGRTGMKTGRRLVHRVTNLNIVNGNKFYVTKGDANDQPDPEYVTKEMIVGKVWFSIPVLGYLYYVIQTKWGIVLFLIIPAYLLVKSEIGLVKNINKN